ncbi:alpha-galactosidase A [Verticillium dahliae]|nr:alpha-galactosidase A [Verticillium dahliae]
MGPVILSMEVDDDDSWDSYYRLRIGSQIKYLVISPGTFDRDTLSLPLQSLPKLPTGDWTMAKIFRDKATGDLRTRSKQLTASAFEVITPRSVPTFDASSPATMIAKIARFEWEVPRIERETIAYQLLEGSGPAPRFLAHIHENGRIMGFLLEKLEGRHASIQDLSACEAEKASPELMQKELESLSGQLGEESGRGGGFMPWEDSD